MINTDIEVEAYGVQVTAYAVTLHVRTPTGEIVQIAMPRVMADALTKDIRMGLEGVASAQVWGAE